MTVLNWVAGEVRVSTLFLRYCYKHKEVESWITCPYRHSGFFLLMAIRKKKTGMTLWWLLLCMDIWVAGNARVSTLNSIFRVKKVYDRPRFIGDTVKHVQHFGFVFGVTGFGYFL